MFRLSASPFAVRRRVWAVALSGCCALSPGAGLALDAAAQDGPDKLPVAPPYASAREALTNGLSDLQAGNLKGSLDALNYAADGGEPLAMWKLGHMYLRGEGGVAKDDVKAFRYFDALVRAYDEDKADRSVLGATANAFVAVAQYQLNGIPGSDVRPDPERALTLLQYAATNFKSTDAQFDLGRLYLDGTAVTAKDPVRAARWLALAASKGHRGAEATFGHLLFAGLGVPVQRARGLKWEILAKSGAQGPHDAWIVEGFAKDWALAGEDDREMALAYVSDGKLDDEIAGAQKAKEPMALGAIGPLPAPPAATAAASVSAEAK